MLTVKGQTRCSTWPVIRWKQTLKPGLFFRRLRDARELGGFDKVDAMLSVFASADLDLPANGPTAVLLARVRRLGWAVGTNGLVQDRYGVFSVMQVGWDELYQRVAMSWGHVMGQEVAHRASFQGIEMADPQAVTSALAHFGTADQVYLRCHLDGTLYTQNGGLISCLRSVVNAPGAQARMVFSIGLGLVPSLPTAGPT